MFDNDRQAAFFFGQPALVAQRIWRWFITEGDIYRHLAVTLTETLAVEAVREIERLREMLKRWTPNPWDMSGWDDESAPEDVLAMIRVTRAASCTMPAVSIPRARNSERSWRPASSHRPKKGR